LASKLAAPCGVRRAQQASEPLKAGAIGLASARGALLARILIALDTQKQVMITMINILARELRGGL